MSPSAAPGLRRARRRVAGCAATVLLLSALLPASQASCSPGAAELLRGVVRRLEPAAVRLAGSALPQRLRLAYVLLPESVDPPCVQRGALEGRPHAAVVGRHALVARKGSAVAVETTVFIGERWVGEICELSAARLAVALGHELAHLTEGHLVATPPSDRDTLASNVVLRAREFAADRLGVQFAEAAGYADALTAATALWLRLSAESAQASTSPLADHPAALERAAELQRDPARQLQWRAALAFEDGVLGLQLGEWEQAAVCLQVAQQAFPRSPEVLSDLAYARMMGYYSGLPAAERRQLGGEVSCLSFARSRPVIRGGTQTDRMPLRQAVAGYRQALAACPGFLPALAGLGAALLMDPAAAPEQLREAAAALAAVNVGAAQTADQEALLADAAANAALARARLRGARAATDYRQAFAVVETRNAVAPALKLNYAQALTAEGGEENLAQAERLLGEYLRQAAPGDYFAEAATALWQSVRERRGLPATPSPAPPATNWLPGTGLLLPGGGRLFVRQPWPAARDALASHRLTLVPAEGPDFTCACSALGLALRVSRGTVRAIVLSLGSPLGVTLRSDREGRGQTLPLRLGQPLAEPERLGVLTAPLLIGGQQYRLYRQVGVAVRLDRASRIEGLAVLPNEL